MICPFCTMELKSAPSHDTVPETWLPTLTLVTGCTVPVVATVLVTGLSRRPPS